LKSEGAIASFSDRLAMVELLCAAGNGSSDEFRFQASDIDGPRDDGRPNFTVDTLRRLRLAFSAQHAGTKLDPLFTIVGADSFLDLRRWRAVDEVLSTSQWIVVSRPGFSLDDLDPLRLTPQQLEHVHLLEGVHEPVSSTEVRERLATGQDCSNLLTPEVLGYIRRHELYGFHGAE
jgi:nicotinate-nucleotide adenylyltransferase